jgi:hypothetical protein
MPTPLFKITENNWTINYEFSGWPLYLTLLLSISLAFILFKEYQKYSTWTALWKTEQGVNYSMLLFACLVVVGLLSFYKLIWIMYITLAGIMAYKLYKVRSEVGELNLRNLNRTEKKYLTTFLYSLFTLWLYTKLTMRGGGLNVHAFALIMFVTTAILAHYLMTDTISLRGVSLKKQPYRSIFILFSIAVLIRIMNLKGATRDWAFKIYPGQGMNAEGNIISLFLLSIGIVTCIFFVVWIIESTRTPQAGTKANVFFRNTTYGFTTLIVFLFYFGDNTFSNRLETKSSTTFSSNGNKSKSGGTINGTYYYNSSSLKCKISVYGGQWFSTTTIVSGFGDAYDESKAERHSGIIKGNDIYDESGYVKIGNIEGNSLSLSGERYLTLKK